MSASRRTILNRIMQIEEELKDINTDSDYRRIKRNLDILDASRTGSRNISVKSPEDMSKTIVVRRHSVDQAKVKDEYKVKLREYTSRLDELFKEKRGLEKQLFT
jgi:vacuolar-type H+-ATPase subunit E/Vma4